MSDDLNGWLIHKQGRGWYRPDAKGYTMSADEAGRYTHKDAMAYSHPNGIDGPRDGLTIKHESELPPSRADYIEALDAQLAKAKALARDAYLEGYKDGHRNGTSDFMEGTDPEKSWAYSDTLAKLERNVKEGNR